MPDNKVISFFKRKLVYHTAFWIMYFTGYFVVIVYGMYGVRDPMFYVQVIPFVLIDLVMVYVNLLILIPRYLATGRYFRYGFGLLLVMVLTAVLNIAVKSIFAKIGSPIFLALGPLNLAMVLAVIAERFYLVGLTTAIRITKSWLLDRRLIKEKENQFLETELNFLKSQIQPHFFFNTLNNLYSLTLQKSDKAPEVVLKLSELMSYMLYEANTPTVALTAEINYLENYIDLEKLRFGNRLQLSFEVNGDPNGIRIPPLLLILFVENSFKHGVRNNIGKTEIRACLEVEPEFVSFKIENPLITPNLPSAGGIGLKNVRRRLELLYGNNFHLATSDAGGLYSATLRLPVSPLKTNDKLHKI